MICIDGNQIPCICVTNRRLCQGDFYERIRLIAEEKKADAIVLREKDLTEEEYAEMAERVIKLCSDAGTECILHTFIRVAKQLQCRKIHLPLGDLETLGPKERDCFDKIGSSVHSVEQAKHAVSLGADYITAGHVFDTDCKKGIPGRGCGFIREITEAVSVPVYGIGGINKKNAARVYLTGVYGVCMMSEFFKHP